MMEDGEDERIGKRGKERMLRNEERMLRKEREIIGIKREILMKEFKEDMVLIEKKSERKGRKEVDIGLGMRERLGWKDREKSLIKNVKKIVDLMEKKDKRERNLRIERRGSVID